MKWQAKRYLALLIVFAMILSANVTVFAQAMGEAAQEQGAGILRDDEPSEGGVISESGATNPNGGDTDSDEAAKAVEAAEEAKAAADAKAAEGAKAAKAAEEAEAAKAAAEAKAAEEAEAAKAAEEAEASVKKAEGSKLQEDVNEAQALVTALGTADVDGVLQFRLDLVEVQDTSDEEELEGQEEVVVEEEAETLKYSIEYLLKDTEEPVPGLDVFTGEGKVGDVITIPYP